MYQIINYKYQNCIGLDTCVLKLDTVFLYLPK